MENSSFFPTVTPRYNVTTEPTPLTAYREVPHAAVLSTVLGVASVVGTLGNTLVLLSIIKFDNLRDIPDLFIFSLSLSDLLVTALYQPLKAYRIKNFQEISRNEAFLGISAFLGYFSLIASIINVFWVTVERLISIRFPLKYDILVTRPRAIVTLVCIWTFSVTLGIIVSRKNFLRPLIRMFFLLSIAGTVSIYIYIFSVAKRHAAAVVQSGSFQNEERPSIPIRKHKAAKTIAIILGVSLSCWLPLLIFGFFLSKAADIDPSLLIFFSLQTLSVCNSSINPYIYCARSRRYYVAFVTLLGLRKLARAQAPVAPREPREVSNELQIPQSSLGPSALCHVTQGAE